MLSALPCAVHRRPTGANHVRRSSQIARGALPVPVLTMPHSVLGEDFGAKEQNRGIIKEIKMNPQWNLNESPIWLEIRFGMKSRTRTTPFPFK
jgi:hypothetical protein